MQTFGTVLLWLFVILLGISVGAGLYEARIVLPIWAETPPATGSTPASTSGRS